MAKSVSTKKLIKQEEKALKKKEKNKKKNISPKKSEKDVEKNLEINEEDFDNNKRMGRKKRIAIDKKKDELARNSLVEGNESIDAMVPVKVQKRFLYYTSTIRNLEKAKRKLAALMLLFMIAGIAFASLFIYERGEVKRTYNHIANRAVQDTIDTIEGFNKNPVAEEKFSRMLTGEVNTVRMAAEELDIENEYSNKLNEVYYLMVNYPTQMKKHYDEMLDIYKLLKKDITNKKAYDKIDKLYKSIDMMGK